MEKLKAKLNNFTFKGILAIILVFALIAVILLVELSGVRFRYAKKSLTLLAANQIVTKEESCAGLEKTTLLLYSTEDKASSEAYLQFEVILNDMKLGTDAINLSVSEIPDLNNYSLVIVLFLHVLQRFFGSIHI